MKEIKVCSHCGGEQRESVAVHAFICENCEAVLNDQGIPWSETQKTANIAVAWVGKKISGLIRTIGGQWFFTSICRDEQCNCSNHNRVEMSQISEGEAAKHLYRALRKNAH